MAWREQGWIWRKEGRRGKVADMGAGANKRRGANRDEQITVLYREDSFCLMTH